MGPDAGTRRLPPEGVISPPPLPFGISVILVHPFIRDQSLTPVDPSTVRSSIYQGEDPREGSAPRPQPPPSP